MRVLVIDDEPPARRKLRNLLEAEKDLEVAEAATGAEALRNLEETAVDLVFLDIEMPGLNGFDILERAHSRNFLVIFVTAHEQFALRAFQAEAFDYLLKPVDPVRFERVMDRVKEQIRVQGQAKRIAPAPPPRYLSRLVVEESDRSFFLPVSAVDWVESARNYVCIHVPGATHVLRSTLDEIASRLDPDRFLRINRSQLINLDRVREMRRWFHGEQIVILYDGTELRWSRRFRAQTSLF